MPLEPLLDPPLLLPLEPWRRVAASYSVRESLPSLLLSAEDRSSPVIAPASLLSIAPLLSASAWLNEGIADEAEPEAEPLDDGSIELPDEPADPLPWTSTPVEGRVSGIFSSAANATPDIPDNANTAIKDIRFIMYLLSLTRAFLFANAVPAFEREFTHVFFT